MNELILNLDKPRKIRFSLNALIAAAKDISIKEKKKCTAQMLISKFFVAKEEDVTFEDMRLLAWIGLKADDPTITLEEAGEIFDLAAIQKFGGEVERLFFGSFPQEKELPKKKPAKKKIIKSKPLKKRK